MILSTWAMGDSLEDLVKAGNAEINLVVSAVGLRAAKALKEKFGTPYVIGTPYKEYAERISEALEKENTYAGIGRSKRMGKEYSYRRLEITNSYSDR